MFAPAARVGEFSESPEVAFQSDGVNRGRRGIFPETSIICQTNRLAEPINKYLNISRAFLRFFQSLRSISPPLINRTEAAERKDRYLPYRRFGVRLFILAPEFVISSPPAAGYFLQKRTTHVVEFRISEPKRLDLPSE